MSIDVSEYPDPSLPNHVASHRQSPFSDSQITILWDDKRYSEEFRAKINAIMEADPDLWFIHMRDSKGRELLMFRGSHP